MRELQGGCGRGARTWLRGAVLLAVASLAGHAGLAQSVRLVPSTERVAGNPITGNAGDGGIATSITLNGPTYVAADLAGNTYISDTGNNCVRRVDASGQISVTVGQPTGSADTCQNPGGVNGSAASGVLQPAGIAVSATGDLFIADSGHNCVRRLPANSTGIASLQPLVDTCARNSTTSIAPAPAGLALDPAGNLYIAINDTTDGIYQVIRSSPTDGYATACLVNGAPSTAVPTFCAYLPVSNPAVVLNQPQGLTLDPIGNLYIADSGNACVREVTAVGLLAVPVGQCASDGVGSPSTALQKPVSVVADIAGHLYINDQGAVRVYELIAGQILPVAGNGLTGNYASTQDGQAAVSVPLNSAQGLGADSTGNVYLADTANNIIRKLSQGLRFPNTPVSSPSPLQDLQFLITSPVNLTASTGGDYQIFSNNCQGPLSAPPGGRTCQVTLRFRPTLPGLRSTALTLSDSTTNPATTYHFGLNGLGQSAEAIFISGTIKSIATSLTAPSAVAIDSSGDVYYAEGNGSVSMLAAGSATPTQLVAAGGGITTPAALALDAAGNLYIADATANKVLRYDTSGNLNTVVSGLDHPVALVVDPLGNIYIAEDGATTVGLLEVYAGGQQAFIAGRGVNPAPNGVLATTAQFIHPSALYRDADGQLYVADAGARRVYRIDTAGRIFFFAGNGTATDTNPTDRLGIGLAGITGVSGDPAGDVYIADGATSRVFVAFSGSSQNPSVSVLAGTGTAGGAGDNGPANLAQLSAPSAVAVDGAAEVFIADPGNASVREITYVDPTLNFGIVPVGQTAGPLGTILWNAGNASLSPIGTRFLDDAVNFSVDAANTGCGNSLSPGATCDLSYFFNPKVGGNLVSHDHFADSSVNPTQLVTLLGVAPQAIITSPNVTVIYGDAYTLAATISGNLATGPTGTATFSIGAATLCAAQTLPANGAVACSPSPTLEDVGVYTVTVSYSGDNNYPAGTSTIQLTVLPRPVTITADNQTRPINTPNPTLTGTVVNVVAGQSIVATYSTTAVLASPAGGYPITPAFTFGPGTNPADYTVTVVNGTLTVTDNGGGTGGGGGGTGGGGGGGGGTGGGGGGGTGSGGSFTLAAAPPEQEIDHNGTVNYPVTLGSAGGFTGDVTLSCSGLPENAACAFAPASVTLASGATGTTVMTITATADKTNVPTIFGALRDGGARPTSQLPLLAWTMLPFGLGGSAATLLLSTRRRRLLLLLPLVLLAAAGVSGCAGPSNYKVYTVTITGIGTSGGATITQSSTVDLTLAR